MTTKRESILAAIVTALTGTIGVGTRIYRSRVEPLTRGESPAIIVEPVQDQPNQTVIGYLQWMLTVRIGVYVRGSSPDNLADATIQSLHSKLLADLTLGGICQDIQPVNVTFLFEEGDQPAGFIACDYNITYRTQLTDLTVSV